MDDALKAYHREQPAGNRSGRNGAEDQQAKETTSISPTFALEEELQTRDFGLSGHGESFGEGMEAQLMERRPLVSPSSCR